MHGIDWFLAPEFSGVRESVVGALHITLAVLVTVHVLLTKRDVGSAIGWIGLAWLSPILGPVLYYLLGINRVRRRAHEAGPGAPRQNPDAPDPSAGRDDHLKPLALAVRRVTRRPAVTGNSVALLHSGDEAYPPMLAAIEAAERSVALSTYIFRADAAGNPFIEALIRARRRGAEIRVLIDGIGSGYFHSPTFERLRRAGVPVARFMHSPLPWRMPFLNLRTHKKILVVDGVTGFTGGLNIGRENLVRTDPPHPVRDSHFAFRGPVVGQLAEAFSQDWLFATGEQLAGKAWLPDIADAGEAVARVITSGPDQDMEKIELIALQATTCARRSIRIMTPYFLPDDRLITALALAAMRGVEVEVMLPARSNHILVDWASRANITPLLTAGCHVWLNPPPFDHSKMMVVDGVWSMIGSANWDVRSFRLNFELNVEVYHSDLAAGLEADMRAKRGERLTLAELRRRPLPLRLRDAGVRLMLPYL